LVSYIDRGTLTVIEDRVLRTVRTKRNKATGDWRKLDEEFHNWCSSPDNVKMRRSNNMKQAGPRSTPEGHRKCIQIGGWKD
jgi:hypothetical protein